MELSNFNTEHNDSILKIYVISDSIGETGELIAKASVEQFETVNYEIKRSPYHNSIEQMKPVLERAAKDKKSLVVYTNVDVKTRAYIEKKREELGLHMVDVMGPPMGELQSILKYDPK